MRTPILIAAEAREFDGILKRSGRGSRLNWPAKFAREVSLNGRKLWLIANGPGPRSIDGIFGRMPPEMRDPFVSLISTGFCGALDPGLRIGDIVVSGDMALSCDSNFARGEIVSVDRVAVTVAEKKALQGKTGAIAVDMETADIKRYLWQMGDAPFYCIRAVSDIATEDMPLDFNQYRDSNGRFSRTRIALAAVSRPFTRIPALKRLEANCDVASESLGAFFADCRF